MKGIFSQRNDNEGKRKMSKKSVTKTWKVYFFLIIKVLKEIKIYVELIVGKIFFVDK